jgi:nucleoid DNA-binding protein
MTCKRSDLEDVLFKRLGLNRPEAKLAVALVLDAMTDALRAGEEVKLHNFGVLTPTIRAARVARNPRTNEQLVVPPRRVVVFRAADCLLEGDNVSPLKGEK